MTDTDAMTAARDHLARIGDPTERAEVAARVFGRRWAEYVYATSCPNERACAAGDTAVTCRCK